MADGKKFAHGNESTISLMSATSWEDTAGEHFLRRTVPQSTFSPGIHFVRVQR